MERRSQLRLRQPTGNLAPARRSSRPARYLKPQSLERGRSSSAPPEPPVGSLDGVCMFYPHEMLRRELLALRLRYVSALLALRDLPQTGLGDPGAPEPVDHFFCALGERGN